MRLRSQEDWLAQANSPKQMAYAIGQEFRAFANAIGVADEAFGLGPRAITVYPTGGSDDSTVVQAAADIAVAGGLPLVLGPGTFNFPTSGIACKGGSFIGSTIYKALQIYGSGSNNTKVVLGSNVVGFWWHTEGQTYNTQNSGGLYGMSIVGAGITDGAIGFQVGGKESSRSNLMEIFAFRDLIIDNVKTCAIFDDVTGLEGSNFEFLRYKYAIEWGYNCDLVNLTAFRMGKNNSDLIGATVSGITNGVATFTVSSSVAAQLQVGYAINMFNSVGVAVFPAQTYVGSIVGTTITAKDYQGTNVNATLASGTATSANFYVGRVFNFGARLVDVSAGTLYPQYGSPFVSPYWSTLSAATRGRLNANGHKYFGVASSVERIADIGGASHFDIEFHIYDENVSEGYMIGDAGQTLAARNLKWDGCYPNSGARLLQPWVYSPNTANGIDCEISIRNCSVDSTATVQPFLQIPTYDGNIKVVWENNDLGMYSTNPNVVLFSSGAFGAKFQLAAYKCLYAGSARKGDALVSASLSGTYAWNWCGQDGFVFTLGSNSTLSNPAAGGTTCIGKSFTVVAVQDGTGGYTFTFGSKFKDQSGSGLGTISSGTANKRMIATFFWDGSYFWCLNTPAFI